MKKFFNRRTFRILLVPMFLILTAGHFGCVEPEPAAPIVQNPIDTTKKDTTKKDTIKPDPYDPNLGKDLWKVYTSFKDKISSGAIGNIGYASDRLWMFETGKEAVYFLKDGIGGHIALGIVNGDKIQKRLAVDSDNNVWYPSLTALKRWSSGTTTDVSNFGGISGSTVVDVVAKGRKVWVSTIAGAAEFDGSSWKKLPTSGWQSRSYLAIGNDGTIWAVSGESLKKLNGNSWQSVVGGTAGQDKFTSIAVDGKGWVWYAYKDSPLFLYDGKDAWMYDKLAPSFSGIACSGGDTVWVGTTQGVYRYAGGTWVNFLKANGLGDDAVTTVAVDPQGNKWFGGTGILTRYAGK